MSAGRELGPRLTGVPDLEIEAAAPLAPLNTFRIGGLAELLVEARTAAALEALLARVEEAGAPFQVLGLGSNVLIPDEGLRGVVARLGGELREVSFDGERVTAGAGVALAQLARRTASQGLVGLEALTGFPSTVGGAVVMNAGCYGTEIKDVLISTTVVEPGAGRRTLGVAELGAAYRTTALQGTRAVVIDAVFGLRRGEAVAALARIQELNKRRWASLPSGKPNVGSIFRNPPGDYAGRLIDVCGLKGRTVGGAQISEKHGNVIVNLGGASAADVLELMVLAHRAVRERFGIDLEPEVVLAGDLGARWRRRTAG